MKTYYKLTIAALFFLMITGACDKNFLERPVEADVVETDLFKTYKDYQGYIDYLYTCIIDVNRYSLTTTCNIGAEVIGSGTMGWTSGNRAMRGAYNEFLFSMQSNWMNISTTNPIKGANTAPSGEWPDSWQGIRTANVAIANIDLFQGTEAEKNLLLGQAYFFRAYLHLTLIRTWGGMPYIDKLLLPNDDLSQYSKRLTYQETTEKIVLDFDRAAALLPDDWSTTSVGEPYIGRITKGAALGLKARALLYAGSPMMNGASGGDYGDYNKPIMERAAIAAWECIKWAQTTNKSYLEPFDKYAKMFSSNDGSVPWAPEVLMSRIQTNGGSGLFANMTARTYTPDRQTFGGGTNGNIDCLNQLYADRFEMADGTKYKPGLSVQGGYDDQNDKRWNNRDPRFRMNIYVDRDTAGFATSTILEMYNGGKTRNFVSDGAAQRTPYIIKKWWPRGVNNIDKVYTNYYLHTPIIRLADVYLMYAEAVTVTQGPTGKVADAITAVDAVNMVRARAGMPNATAAAPGYAHQVGDAAGSKYSTFLELIRNERFVELCFEGHWWYDMRRWYILHLDQNREVYDLRFDKDYTFFNRILLAKMVFDNPKHYWAPIPSGYSSATINAADQTKIFSNFKQNPGWD